jgi:hypothetical protein
LLSSSVPSMSIAIIFIGTALFYRMWRVVAVSAARRVILAFDEVAAKGNSGDRTALLSRLVPAGI